MVGGVKGGEGLTARDMALGGVVLVSWDRTRVGRWCQWGFEVVRGEWVLTWPHHGW